MQIEVLYKNITYNGKIEIFINCNNEREYNISVENRKWLYPKIENILFGIECFIRTDPSMSSQINEVLDRTIDDLRKLIKISEDNN